MESKTSIAHTFRKALLHSMGFLLVMAIVLSACSTPTSTPPPVPTSTATPAPTPVVIDVNQLYANPWILVAYGDPTNPTVVAGGVDLTANFSPDGQLSGFGGCNTFSGSAQVATDGTMTIGPLATTLMACAEGMDLETAYLSALQNARSFSFSSEGRLQITYGPETGANQMMVFIVGAKTLTESNWVLVSYGDPAAPQPVPSGLVITAAFSSDGFMTGLSGCNQYNVPYTLQGNQITLGPIAITQMTCPTGMEAEQAYLTALGAIGQYTISGPTLTLTYNQGAGVLIYTSANLPLEYSLWTLTAMNGQAVITDTNVTATFTPGETANAGNISGSSGCNTYNAGYTLNGSNLAVQPAATTMMFCATGMETEQAYLQALQTSTSYEIFVDKLVLTNPTGSLLFTANRTPLTAALWQLVSLGDVKKPVTPVKGSSFTAQFIHIPGAPSGVLNGTTGCNEYTAAFAASASEIKINLPVSTTNTSCTPGLSDQEKLYFLALNDATNYHISGNVLTIPYDSGKQALVYEGTQLLEAQRPPLTNLNGTTWYLWYMNNTPILAGTSIYALFAINPDGASGTINGSAGCNTYVATFGDNLAVQTTLNAVQSCNSPKGVMDQEKAYVNMLSRAYGYWQTGDQLIVNTGQGVLTYRSTIPGSSYDQTHLLVGPTWFLISYGSTYSTPGSQEPYTLFKTDGTLEGFTGCNTLKGNFTTATQGITITNLNAAQQACPNSTLQTQQDAMLKILGTAMTYQVAETVMQIISDSGALNYSLSPLNRPEEVAAPVAAFTAPDESPVNSTITFDATPSTSGVPIVYYEWDFGDGAFGSGMIVQHVYTSATTHNVGLTITDELGKQSTLQKRLVIYETAVPPTPTPVPTAQPTATTPPTAPPAPTATGLPTQPPQPTATTVPPQPTATPAPTQPPAPVPPTAAIQGPGNGYVGEPIFFDASGSSAGSSPIVSYAWNFGDGTTAGPSGNSNMTTLYNQSGTFQASVVVMDQNGLSSSATMPVTISTRLGTPVVYLLNSLNGQGVLPGTAITLQFLQGQVAGFDGCNSYSGSYVATPNPDGTYAVTISGGLIGGGMACPAEIMDQASAYKALLSTTNTALIEGTVVTLGGPNGSLLFYQSGTLSITPY
jgi:heat shock protein HslJ